MQIILQTLIVTATGTKITKLNRTKYIERQERHLKRMALFFYCIEAETLEDAFP